MVKPTDYPHLSALQKAVAEGNLDAAREAIFTLKDEEKALLEAELGTATVQLLLRTARKRRRAKWGRVIVINGIMGALLNSVDSGGDADRIWINFLRIIAGRIADLKLTPVGQPADPAVTIQLAGLHSSYLPMLLELDADWHVLPFPFDWRLDIDKSAERLAAAVTSWSNGEPVHLVAHSMGGLVSRRFIQRFPDVWSGMIDPDGLQRGGRLIMLGTPNKGAFAIPLILSGKERIVKWLAGVDFKHSLNELLRITNTFPGSYQMLPSPHMDLGDDHAKLFKTAPWGKHPVQQPLLNKGRDFQTALQNIIEPERMIYVAGYDQKTPYRIQVKSPGQFKYQRTRDGDGRVSHELGLLEGLPTFWVRESHGDLPKNDQVLAGIHDLLVTGTTHELPRQRPTRRLIEEPENWLNPEDLMPVSNEARILEEKIESQRKRRARRPRLTELEAIRFETLALENYLGTAPVGAGKSDTGSAARRGGKKPRKDMPLLDVEVVWGDITQASGDVYCVGHYEGVLPQAAEAALDMVVSPDGAKEEDRLLWRLTKRGILRGALGDINFYPWAGRGSRGRIVAVAGMGPPGNFTAGDLRHLGRRLAFAIGSLPDARTACTLLIGSGNGGLPLETAVSCLVRGLDDAMDEGLSGPIIRLRIVEYQLGKARLVHQALQQIKEQEDLDIRIRLKSTVTEGRGGGISDEYGLALALVTTAEAADARTDSVRNKAVETLLRSVPVPTKHRKVVKKALECLGRSADETSIQQLAANLTIGDRLNSRQQQTSPTRISFVKERNAIGVAAINNSTVVSKRDLGSDFSLVMETIARTTDPDPDSKNIAELAEITHERLVPKDFRDCVERAEPLIVEVDRAMAAVHWEFLPRTGTTSVEHPEDSIISLNVPLARQLRTTYSPPPMPLRPAGSQPKALVIGDPGDPAVGDNLPGAQLEAEQVARILVDKGFEVEIRIGAPTGQNRGPIPGVLPASRLDVLHLINSADFDLLHYAGHGDFDPDDPSRVGWLFKGGLITAAELENLDRAPQIVVANACLSARTSAALRGGSRFTDSFHEIGLLPSLADEFFRRGVYNYIGTAWEVDDAGAVLFAKTFYNKFLPEVGTLNGGTSIGEAIKIARVRLFNEADRYGSLWAAYQHYGDPTFEF